MFRDYIKFIVLSIGLLIIIVALGAYLKFNSMSKLKNNDISPPLIVKEQVFEEGKHYKKLSAKITTDPEVIQFFSERPNKIQVIEFFNYACFWCKRIHPVLNQWIDKHQDRVTLNRIPVLFGQGWDVLAKAYYMVESLGKNRLWDMSFFKAVHDDQINLGNIEKLKEFFVKLGLPAEKFDSLYHSFQTTQAFNRGQKLEKLFSIGVSPVVIIRLPAGTYMTSPVMAGENEEAIVEVLEHLLQKKSS